MAALCLVLKVLAEPAVCPESSLEKKESLVIWHQ